MKQKKYFLTFATNFKNENPYLKEWLDYHLRVGVDHFYLYDQDGGEEAKEIIKPYEERGQVTRHLWTQWNDTKYDQPTRFYQRDKNHMGFAHAAKNYRQDFQWVMKIDVDEFLYPLNGETNLADWLKTVDAGKIKGVKVPRINFGNNGHEKTPEMSVLRAYTRREELYSDHKDLANGDFLSGNRFAFSAHWWHYKWYKFGEMIKNHRDIGWRMNHYYTKSYEEYRRRQNVMRSRDVSKKSFEKMNQLYNEVEDLSMVKLLDQISN